MDKKILITLFVFILILISFILWHNPSQESEPQKITSQPANITIFLTGDVMLGRGVSSVINSNVDVFGDLTSLFKMSDLTVINLEDPLTTSTKNYKSTVPLKADPNVASVLKNDHINVTCLANNHIMDYGEAGLNDTLKTLKTNNITVTGAGANLDEATQPAYFTVDNHTIAILNYFDTTTFQGFSTSELPPATANSSGFAPANWDVMKEKLDQAKSRADIVIVVFHYGNEYSTTPNQDQQSISRKCIDEGADLVVGSHPHIPQKVESYQGKLICYSLGNCVFDQSNTATQYSMVVQLQDLDGNLTATLYPIHIVNCCPRLMETQSANTFLENIKSQSNANITIQDGKGIIHIS